MATVNVGAALRHLSRTKLRTLRFVAVSWLLQFLTAVCLHLGVALPLSVDVELHTSPTFRDHADLRMLYPPFFSPFVHSFLVLLFALACFGPPAVARWTFADAARFTLSAWATVSAGHGILLEYCVFRISWRIVVQFWFGTLAAALTTAYALARVYSDRPAAKAVREKKR